MENCAEGTRFFVGGFLPENVLPGTATAETTDILRGAHEWVRTHQRDLYDWINETAGDRWKIVYDGNRITYPDSSGRDLTFDFVDLYVVYEEDSHAVLHKLRWY